MKPKAPVFSEIYDFAIGDLVELHSSQEYKPESAFLFRTFKNDLNNMFNVSAIRTVPNGSIALLLESVCIVEDKVLVSVLYDEAEYLAIAEQLRPIKQHAASIQKTNHGESIDSEVPSG